MYLIITKKGFESYGWNFIEINGHNVKQIDTAIKKAHRSKKPTLICKTIVMGHLIKLVSHLHGAPLGDDEIKLVRKNLNGHMLHFEIP